MEWMEFWLFFYGLSIFAIVAVGVAWHWGYEPTRRERQAKEDNKLMYNVLKNHEGMLEAVDARLSDIERTMEIRRGER